MLQLLLSASVFTFCSWNNWGHLVCALSDLMKGSWSCMFCPSDLVFCLEDAKCEQNMGIAFGSLTACLRAHLANVDCSLSFWNADAQSHFLGLKPSWSWAEAIKIPRYTLNTKGCSWAFSSSTWSHGFPCPLVKILVCNLQLCKSSTLRCIFKIQLRWPAGSCSQKCWNWYFFPPGWRLLHEGFFLLSEKPEPSLSFFSLATLMSGECPCWQRGGCGAVARVMGTAPPPLFVGVGVWCPVSLASCLNLTVQDSL